MQVTVNLTTEQILDNVRAGLEELDKINEFLFEYGITYPTGYRAVQDMHSQLAGRLEECENDNARLRAECAAHKDYSKVLEDMIIQAASKLEEDAQGEPLPPEFDPLRMQAANILERRKAARSED